MKDGRTLLALAHEVERQSLSKKDYIADSRRIQAGFTGGTVEGTPVLRLVGKGEFSLTRIAHQQVAERLGIPQRYYDRMVQTAPRLWQENVHHWFQVSSDKRMVRTLDGQIRALVSERYRPLDNIDLLKAVLPRIKSLNADVLSCEITESRLYIKAVTARITADVSVGDIVQAGIVISNSEVGMGSIRVEPLIYRLSCRNGAIVNDAAFRTSHIGRGHRSGLGDDSPEAQEFYKDETRQADDKAFWLKVRDTVDAAVDVVQFRKTVQRMQDAKSRKITGDVAEIVEVVTDRLACTDDEGAAIMRHLIEGGELSAYGLGNAVTRMSQDVKDYDRATDFERAGFGIWTMPKAEWERLASN